MSSGVTRREVLRTAAAAGALAGLQALAPAEVLARALAAPAARGRLSDIEHVVIFVNENRSFDHYFGTYRGVRGFSDPNVPQSQGLPVWYQSDNGLMPAFGPPSGYLAPFRIDRFSRA